MSHFEFETKKFFSCCYEYKLEWKDHFVEFACNSNSYFFLSTNCQLSVLKCNTLQSVYSLNFIISIDRIWISKAIHFRNRNEHFHSLQLSQDGISIDFTRAQLLLTTESNKIKTDFFFRVSDICVKHKFSLCQI